MCDKNGTVVSLDGSYDPTTLEASQALVNYHRWVLGKVSSVIGGRTLELEAGTGTVSTLLKEVSSELVLVEPAPNLCRTLEDRFSGEVGVSIWCGTLEKLRASEAWPNEKFRTVVSFNVLEHIEDDRGTLRLARQLLEPGGRLVLFVPSLPRLYGVLDAQVGHLRRYTKQSLSAVVAEAGFKLERIQYVDLLGIIPWFLAGRVLRRVGMGETSGMLRIYDRFIVPAVKAVDWLTGAPVGKNLLTVACRVDA